MKKFGKNVLAGIFAIFIGCFSSCNLISSDGDSSGSFEFSVSSDLARKVSSKASVLSQYAGSDQSQEKFIIKVDVSGDYQTQVSKEYTMEQWERVMSGLETVTFTIDNIPVSSVIKVKVKVIFALPDWERLILVGESDQITVKEGSNPLNIVLSDAPSDSSGSILIENGVVTITTSDISSGVHLNDIILFGAKDSSGKAVTGVEYNAHILYKGKDVQELLTDPTTPYYTVSGNTLAMNGVNNPLPAGSYQLYITATYNDITSSTTFDITVLDTFATPETQVALYNKSSSNYKYSFYLTDEEDIETADLPEESTYSSSKDGIAFDINGKFYMLNNNQIISNNTQANGSNLSSDISSYYNNGFVIDIAKNMSYAYGINEMSLYLFKYPSLIANGITTDVVSYDLINESDYWWQRLAVDNGLLYIYATKTIDSKTYDYIVTYDISSGNTANKIKEFVLTNYMTSTMGLSASSTISDIFAMEGAVYILVSDSWQGLKNSHGSVIKYIPPTSGSSETVAFIDMDIADDFVIKNTDIPYMYLYETSFDKSPVYADANGTSYLKILGNKYSQDNNNGVLCNTHFPTLYSIAADDLYLSSPQKVIAVKPKKLVISDDGIAFYTDNDGNLFYKNMNRVATIDLETFVIDSIQTTTAKFETDVSDFLRSTLTLDTVRSGGTYYDYEAAAWVLGSDNNYHTYSLYSNLVYNQIYLSIKEGN